VKQDGVLGVRGRRKKRFRRSRHVKKYRNPNPLKKRRNEHAKEIISISISTKEEKRPQAKSRPGKNVKKGLRPDLWGKKKRKPKKEGVATRKGKRPIQKQIEVKNAHVPAGTSAGSTKKD